MKFTVQYCPWHLQPITNKIGQTNHKCIATPVNNVWMPHVFLSSKLFKPECNNGQHNTGTIRYTYMAMYHSNKSITLKNSYNIQSIIQTK